MRALLATAASLLAVPAAAQEAKPEPLALAANSRFRIETIDHQVRPGFSSSETLFSIRTILSAEYGPGPVRIGGELYDSRVYSPGPRSVAGTGEVNVLEPVQAYIKADLGPVLAPGTRLRLQAGRFTLNLGSRRLVAADDYRNTTNGYTGLRADLAGPGGWSATFVYTLPQLRLPDDGPGVRANRLAFDRESGDLRLWGAFVAKARAIGPASLDLAYFRLDERDRPNEATRDRRLDTFSARLFRAPARGRLDYELEGIGQLGRVSASTLPGAAELAVGAWFAHAELGYQFAQRWSPRIAFEYDHASGDAPGGRYGRFDTLFGMRRADLAPAGLYSAVGRSNIVTPGIRIEVAPSKRLEAFVTYRELWLAARTDAFSTTGVRDPAGAAGRHAGRQFDARVRWWALPKRLQLEADGVLLFKGRFLRAAANAPPGGDSRYLSLNATAFF